MKRLLFLLFNICGFCIVSNAQNLSYVDSLADLISKSPPDTDMTSLLNRLAWENMYSNPDTSIILSNQAVEIANSILISKEAETNEGLKKAAKRELAQSFNCLGVFYWVVSDYNTSIEYHQKALMIRRLTGDRRNEGSSLNNLGLVYKAKGDYNQALKNYFAALSLAIQFEDKSLIATDLSNIGTVYHDMKEPKRALDFYTMAIPLYKEEKDMIGLSMAYSYLANAYVDLGNSKQALLYYSMGIDISKQIGNIYLEAFMINNTGEVYSKLGNDELALEKFKTSLPMAREIGEMALVATVLTNMGSANIKLGNYQEGETYLKEALQISQEIEADPNIELSAWDLSKLYAKTGKFELAYKTQNIYLAAHDSIYNDTKTKELGQLETKHELALEAREKQRAEEERLRTIKREKDRLDLLQTSAIVLSLVVFGLVVMILGFKKVSPKIANGITFFATLLLFEFLLVLLDPTVDKISGGLPAYKLICNAILALGIFPVHNIITRLIKKKLSK